MSDYETTLDTILTACLQAIEDGGWTVEECLAYYHDYRHELEPLLRVALRLRSARALQPSTTFRRQARMSLRMRLSVSSRPLVANFVTKSTSLRSIGHVGNFYRLRRSNMFALVGFESTSYTSPLQCTRILPSSVSSTFTWYSMPSTLIVRSSIFIQVCCRVFLQAFFLSLSLASLDSLLEFFLYSFFLLLCQLYHV